MIRIDRKDKQLNIDKSPKQSYCINRIIQDERWYLYAVCSVGRYGGFPFFAGHMADLILQYETEEKSVYSREVRKDSEDQGMERCSQELL